MFKISPRCFYSVASELNCNKVALGHHLDDFIETLLLNQFYVGKIKAMSPSMKADNGIHTVIRPLVYVEESDIINFTNIMKFPVICCACPVCGKFDLQRKKIKLMINRLSKENPYLRRSMIKAIANVEPRYLMDLRLTKEGI